MSVHLRKVTSVLWEATQNGVLWSGYGTSPEEAYADLKISHYLLSGAFGRSLWLSLYPQNKTNYLKKKIIKAIRETK